jgi:hypothetical protein
MKRILLFFLLTLILVNCKTTKLSSASSHSAQIVTGNAGGDGSSFEKAIVIQEKSEFKGIDAEYAWLKNNYPGYKMIKQSLVNHNKKPYDILTIKTADGETKEIYFDISNFYGKF